MFLTQLLWEIDDDSNKKLKYPIIKQQYIYSQFTIYVHLARFDLMHLIIMIEMENKRFCRCICISFFLDTKQRNICIFIEKYFFSNAAHFYLTNKIHWQHAYSYWFLLFVASQFVQYASENSKIPSKCINIPNGSIVQWSFLLHLFTFCRYWHRAFQNI